MTFAISWIGAFAVAAPQLLRHTPLSKTTGILMFPAMLLGPSLTGVILTMIVDGKSGLRDLVHRIFGRRIPGRWYAAFLIPPALIVVLLLVLERFLSPEYAPNHFLTGIFFGVPAGLLEEIGWTGYVFPKMRRRNSALAASVLLGLLWGTWHLPVINYLGTATPHGRYWFPFFLVFTVAMTAMRVLICWLYSNTASVLLAQLMHISSTGSLVIFSPPRVTAAQEVMWYGLYAALLWLVAGLVVRVYGKDFTALRQ
ncbi:MAG TPA: CPBP family intramembrane glutamic endopeptidase [Bryobacteraceae bacterium]|jgi:membrane protease YdiL (CAAX protease family)|nr:CPBP family intramembrane glutamic endopeptidase [Bryobacteraceae bacterium]